MLGLVNVIVSNGWEDKEFIRTRVSGFEEMVEVAKKYTPEEVENICGIPAEQTKHIAKVLADNRPGSLVITSYSIHYTKLYERRLSPAGPAGLPGAGPLRRGAGGAGRGPLAPPGGQPARLSSYNIV